MGNLDRIAAARFAAVALACTVAVVTEAATSGGPERPAGPGDSASMREVTAPGDSARSARRHRPIFVCRSAGPVIFSDRPCGQFAEARELSFVEPGPGLVATIVRPPPPAATKPRAEPRPPDAKPEERAVRCQRLLDQREKLNARMREGYSARQAAQLWNRWREIAAQVYADRC